MHEATPIEIQLLGASVVLLIVHILAQGGTAVPETGLPWAAGPRDAPRPVASRFAGRAERALANFKETYPAFVGLALALVVMGKVEGVGATGAWIWLGARIAYLPLYLLGVPWLRTLAYGVSLVGLVMMLTALF
jgi:uncharacterized MAPEG superfamily protein